MGKRDSNFTLNSQGFYFQKFFHLPEWRNFFLKKKEDHGIFQNKMIKGKKYMVEKCKGVLNMYNFQIF